MLRYSAERNHAADLGQASSCSFLVSADSGALAFSLIRDPVRAHIRLYIDTKTFDVSQRPRLGGRNLSMRANAVRGVDARSRLRGHSALGWWARLDSRRDRQH